MDAMIIAWSLTSLMWSSLGSPHTDADCQSWHRAQRGTLTRTLSILEARRRPWCQRVALAGARSTAMR
eukprot:7508097-Pyramimonas_sp.AAC.1